jgi:hypothetical protein
MEVVSRSEIVRIFPVDSCELAVIFGKNWQEIIGKKSRKFPARTVRPGKMYLYDFETFQFNVTNK